MEVILKLFNLDKKAEVKKHCREVTISSEVLADVVFNGRIGNLENYIYQCAFINITPEHLELTEANLKTMVEVKPGPIEGKAKTAFNKIDTSFEQRKLLNVHLFHTPSKEYWNMFYFTQRDTTKYNNHWKHGPHIHYSSDLILSTPIDEVWKLINQRKPRLPKSEHIKYDYHHNR